MSATVVECETEPDVAVTTTWYVCCGWAKYPLPFEPQPLDVASMNPKNTRAAHG